MTRFWMLHKLVTAVFISVWIIPALWQGSLGTGWIALYLVITSSLLVVAKTLSIVVLILEDCASGFEHKHKGNCAICGKGMKG